MTIMTYQLTSFSFSAQCSSTFANRFRIDCKIDSSNAREREKKYKNRNDPKNTLLSILLQNVQIACELKLVLFSVSSPYLYGLCRGMVHMNRQKHSSRSDHAIW